MRAGRKKTRNKMRAKLFFSQDSPQSEGALLILVFLVQLRFVGSYSLPREVVCGGSKSRPTQTRFPRFVQLHLFATSFQWLTGLSVSFVIGQSYLSIKSARQCTQFRLSVHADHQQNDELIFTSVVVRSLYRARMQLV